MLSAVVLAAGYSSRAKTNKLALKLGDQTLIERAINPLLKWCDRIVVVTGHYHHELVSVLEGKDKIMLVKNEGYAIGMFSSVQVGVTFTEGDVFILPGDCPMVQEKTLALMVEALKADVCDNLEDNSNCCRTGGYMYDMFVPTYEGHKGHPLLIRACLIDALIKEDYQSNLKAFRNRYKLYEVETNDSGVLKDIDTIEDYEQIAQKDKRRES